MAPSDSKPKAPPRNMSSVLALLSFIALFLVTLSVLGSNPQQQQPPRRPASPSEEASEVDFDKADDVTGFLTSKARQSATGDRFL